MARNNASSGERTAAPPRTTGGRRLPEVTVYREALFSRVSFWLTLFICLSFLLAVIIFGNWATVEGQIVFWCGTVAGSLVLFLGMCLVQLTVSVTQRQLIIAFGIFRRAVPRVAIGGAEPVTINLSEAGGYGMRRGKHGRYWIIGPGPGLAVTYRLPGREHPERITFNTLQPSRLLRILDLPSAEPAGGPRAEPADDPTDDFDAAEN